MKKEVLAAIMATTLLVLSLLSPVTGVVSTSYAADSGGDSVSISESYDVDDTVTINETPDISVVDQGRTAEGTGEADGSASAAQETEVDAEPGQADSTEATIDDEEDNAPVATNKKDAIEDGLAWLAGQQDTATGAWNLNNYPVGSTAFAVLKFEHYAKNIRDPTIDPFDPAYEYKDNIEGGLKYIFQNAHIIDINTEYGGLHNPDVNLVNGQGVFFMSNSYPWNGSHDERPGYETGIVMMAIAESCHPEKKVDAPGSPLHSWTYLNVMRDNVDWLSWAQNDDPNDPGRGGWRYGAYDDGDLVLPAFGHPDSTQSCNSVTQWPILGLIAAAATPWTIQAPGWVKDELNIWLDKSQYLGPNANYYGAFGYTSNTSGHNIACTAAGIIGLFYKNVPLANPDVQAAFSFIARDWNGAVTGGLGPKMNKGNYYAMYAVTKACVLYGIVKPDGMIDEIDWQAEYDRWLLENQNEPDYQPEDPEYGSWPPGVWSDRNLSTEWALLILEKVVPLTPEPPLESFEDLLKSQAELLFSFEDLLKRTWDELSPAEQLEFLYSFEDLLKSQEELIKSFEELLNEEWDNLSPAKRKEYLRSFEELLKSQEELLFSFEDLLKRIEEDGVG